jgi:teichoic acid transport system permease protein
LCAATINVLFRDFHNFMNTILRFLFFISPVMWEPSKDNKLMNFVMMINPFAYILNGYRDTLLYGFNLKESLVPGIIFWAVSIIMFVIGCALIEKFRYKFIDTL